MRPPCLSDRDRQGGVLFMPWGRDGLGGEMGGRRFARSDLDEGWWGA